MQGPRSTDNDFLTRITEIIKEHLSDEQFGVSELAHEIGMSRSNLLRKVKKLTKESVSQLIRQVRLRQAMDMLKKTSLTVSEISYQVGFSSISYFIKCFRDHYGYPPGEVGKRDAEEGVCDQTQEASHSHQLAAIMFTDIEGYTSLMQRDEEKAIKFRNRHREAFNEITKKFNGRILQYFGDGTLSTFHSAIDAVKCGIELQLAFLETPQIPVRIGIHSGDILFTEDGIIGDGVNVASRIESLAKAGSVFISEKVYDEVKNQYGIQTISLGEFELKNVGKPVEVFAVANPGLVVPERHQISGKIKNRLTSDEKDVRVKGKSIDVRWLFALLAVVLAAYLIYEGGIVEINTPSIPSIDHSLTKKSIAVLPFINDSNDSTNVYIINGLMESTLNNLQKIEDLRVISRTSVEKYRNNPKTIPEIARELNVKFLIEGSGQKIGDQILLNIQLIEAQSDKHLWSQQFKREAKDIFQLQMEVAKSIADEIEVIITPEEEERISKPPTEDLVAYDYFLKGLDLLHKPTRKNLEEAIPFFEKAIEQDHEFARSYAAIAIAYYLLDENQLEKRYAAEINHYADKALLYDSRLPQSLIAKGLFYMHNEEYELAASYFEKALEYNPNSDLVLIFLVDLYVNHLPNTEKYLEYALRGINIDFKAYDSITASFSYLHISNAFIQSGFVNEAEKYINKSLDYHPVNLYSEYVRAFILYAKNRDLNETKDLLLKALSKDTTRLDILQEVGKIHYYLRDYGGAYRYYKKFIEMKKALNLDIYRAENAKIGLVLSKMGLMEESERYFQEYKTYAENDPSIYRHFSLAMYYSYQGDTDSAIEHLDLFSQQENYHYWILIFTELDPLVDNIKDHAQFKRIFHQIEDKFQRYHEQIRSSLEKKELI